MKLLVSMLSGSEVLIAKSPSHYGVSQFLLVQYAIFKAPVMLPSQKGCRKSSQKNKTPNQIKIKMRLPTKPDKIKH